MRSKNRNILVALVAILAFGVVAAASASAALPEFVPRTGEKFPKALQVRNLSKVVFEDREGEQLECKEGTASGTITGPKALTVKLTLKHCGYKGSPPLATCTTKGAAEGEIKTEELQAAPVYISKSSKEVGILLNQYTGSEFEEAPAFAVFACGPKQEIKERIEGSVIAPIAAINTKTSKFSLKFRQALGIQKPTQYENEKGEKKGLNVLSGTFNGFNRYQIGLETAGEAELLTAAEVELKA